MDIADRQPGYVRVLLKHPAEAALAAASRAAPAECRDLMSSLKLPRRLMLDYSLKPLPLGSEPASPANFLDYIESPRATTFAIRVYVERNPDGSIPHNVDGLTLYSDPPIGLHQTNLESPAKGKTADVQQKLNAALLHKSGLDGSGVAVAIVDTGIYLRHLNEELKLNPSVDEENSWTPERVATPAFKHRVGHGTMCAYNALIAAPRATLVDVSLLLGRAPADHTVRGTIGTAIAAFDHLALTWEKMKAGKSYNALVVSNSWGIYHPALDFPVGHPGRFIDNPAHLFYDKIAALAHAGADILFCAGNCGPDCPAPACLHRTNGSIMGAAAYPEVLTVGGCDTEDNRVGYSSRGPAIANLPPEKPDLTAYTHFAGSQVRGKTEPDSGTSVSCPVAAGCVAALRSKEPPSKTPPAALFAQLRAHARHAGTGGWTPDFGYGIIDPLETARGLGIYP